MFSIHCTNKPPCLPILQLLNNFAVVKYMAIFIFLYIASFFFKDNFLGMNHWGYIIASKFIIIYMTLPIYDQIAHLYPDKR